MKTIRTAAWVMALGCLATVSSHGAWTENFDSYAPGNINGNGPWVDWGGTLTPDVSTAQSNSGSNSLGLSANPAGVGSAYGSDTYATSLDPGGLLTSGVWNLSYQTYIPSTMTGRAEMYISQFLMDGTGGGFSRGLWLVANDGGGGVMSVRERTAAATPTLVLDAWTPIELTIDLGANTLVADYNGTTVFSGPWDDVAAGPSIGGVNFWADGDEGNGGTYYVDDFSLTAVPEPASLALLGLGGMMMLRRRRRS